MIKSREKPGTPLSYTPALEIAMRETIAGRSRFDSPLLIVIDRLLEEARMLTGAPCGNLQMMNWKSGCLEIAAEYGFEQEFLTYFAKVDASDATCCGRALQARSQTFLENVETDPFPQGARMVMLRAGARSCQSTPMITSSGAFVGILSTHFPVVHRPSAKRMEELRSLARAAANGIIRQIASRRAIDDILRSSGEAVKSSKQLLRRMEEEAE